MIGDGVWSVEWKYGVEIYQELCKQRGAQFRWWEGSFAQNSLLIWYIVLILDR